jgi:hypothetical protein
MLTLMPRSLPSKNILKGGTGTRHRRCLGTSNLHAGARVMNQIVYIVGLVVIVLAVLAFFGLR